MSNLDDVWDTSLPVFLLNAEFNLKKLINLNDLAFRVCLELNLPKELITISYDNCFISFKEPTVNITTIHKFLELLQQLWYSLSSQSNYEHFCELEIYGNYTGKLLNNQYKVLVGLSRRIELVTNLEQINCMSLQKAIQASYVALPF